VRSITTQCGIFSAGGIIMEGPAFRHLSDAALLEVPRLQVSLLFFGFVV
jgi:P-type Ca2+ transporter type 2C